MCKDKRLPEDLSGDKGKVILISDRSITTREVMTDEEIKDYMDSLSDVEKMYMGDIFQSDNTTWKDVFKGMIDGMVIIFAVVLLNPFFWMAAILAIFLYFAVVHN